MELMIFGKSIPVIEKIAEDDFVQFENDGILVSVHGKPTSQLLEEYSADLLYSQLCKIYDEMKNGGKIDIFGDLDFEIVNKIDGKDERIAKLKGRKILVKKSVIALPESALRYMIAHEIAHIFTKRHTKKFWKIVETVYPDFKNGEKLLIKYGEHCTNNFK